MSDATSLNKRFLVNFLTAYRDQIVVRVDEDYATKSYFRGVSDALLDVLREIEAGDFDA